MNNQVYLRQNVVLEPLVNNWYAWSHLVSPVTAAMNLVNNHIKILNSYVKDPDLHARAVASPKMKGGPFVDYNGERVDEIKGLLKSSIINQKDKIEVVGALKKLDETLRQKAKGYSLHELYNEIPECLRGMVELVYDLNNQPGIRFFEGMFYNSEFYREEDQSILLYISEEDDRSFALSTPRLPEENKLKIDIPFNDGRIDKFCQLKDVPGDFDEVCSLFEIEEKDKDLFRTFFTEEAPVRRERYNGEGLRTRYFGHACVLLESKEVSILTDPVISYYYDTDLERFTYLDLPEEIDYVLITHNHQDHILLETMLQLRHKVKNIVIPKGFNCTLQDPSLKLMLENIGFENIIELEDLGEVNFDNGKIIGLPFLGEHSDLDIRTKLGYMVKHRDQSFMFLSDSKNLEHKMYERIHALYGNIDILFIGMECQGAPLSWLYGPLLTQEISREDDQSRRLDGSDFDEAYNIVSKFDCKHVYVYAMGQEPWMDYIMAIEYTDESIPIVESNKLIEQCTKEGLVAERLFGIKEILFGVEELLLND